MVDKMDIKEQFQRNVENHKLEIHQDNGIYRHITPMPWHSEYIRRLLRFGEKNPMAAGLDDEDLRNDEANWPGQSDARLIAASPELLALLIELTDIEGPLPGTATWAAKVKAAIAKATMEEI